MIPKKLLLISITTALVILAIKMLSTLLVYNFFSFDKYLTGVALFFLIAGYFLFSPRRSPIPIPPSQAMTPKDELIENLKTMRFSLTNREFAIFGLLAEGKTNKEISSQLCVEISTVKTHINHLFGKIDCTTRKDAVQRWAQMLERHVI